MAIKEISHLREKEARDYFRKFTQQSCPRNVRLSEDLTWNVIDL